MKNLVCLVLLAGLGGCVSTAGPQASVESPYAVSRDMGACPTYRSGYGSRDGHCFRQGATPF